MGMNFTYLVLGSSITILEFWHKNNIQIISSRLLLPLLNVGQFASIIKLEMGVYIGKFLNRLNAGNTKQLQ